MNLRRYFVFIAIYVSVVPVVSGEPSDWRKLVAAGKLVEIQKVDPTILVEMRYLTARNCVGAPIDPPDLPCLVRPEIAARLHNVQQILRESKYGLKVWDAYRPPAAQRAIWNRWARRGYVADPGDGRGSLHTWGLAVDVTLVDLAGKDVPMPSEFDVFTPEASGIYRGDNETVYGNLRRLQKAMKASGFIALSTEWWHFAARDWERFDPLTPTAGGTHRKLPPASSAQ